MKYLQLTLNKPVTNMLQQTGSNTCIRDHGDSVITYSHPTSEVGFVCGKVVVAYR